MNATRFIFFSLLSALPGVTLALTLYPSPLFLASTEPRVMLTLSRDHQLSIKAYTDYSDLNNDGTLDTTYNDAIDYYGYFDSNKCYAYQSSLYEPSSAVTAGTHQCNSSTWSGNFLNWATMTRMDVLRKTFYGGYRSTDTAGTGHETVLERHFLPNDVHAFVKVYNPGSNATLSLYMPSTVVGTTNTVISMCNVSNSTNTNLTGTAAFTIPPPLIRVAVGNWPQWDSSEVTQCATGSGTRPGSATDFNVRVKVCDSSKGLESNCKTYTHPATGDQTIKPVGLLQQYGDLDADRRVRFGLFTGSYAANKSGGVLRKNATLLANNNKREVTNNTSNADPTTLCSNRNDTTTLPTTNNNANDEVDVCTGQFVNQASTQAGIINTLNRIRIAGFKYTSGGANDYHRYSCNSPGLTSFTNGQCVDWGNPLAETYLESLRYFSNAGATSTFNVSDASILASIPQVTWTDPLPAEEWCALSSVILLSTGLNSFDTDDLASFTPSGGTATIDANTLTNTVGTHEGISGSYLIGQNGTDDNKQCTAKSVSNLSSVKGICPEVPSTEGGYGVAGLAYGPKTIDLRPSYATDRTTRWGGTAAINPDWAKRQPLNTYAVQLAESLPSFDVPVGTGTVTLLPACQANSTGTAPAWTASSTGWRNCSMTNLIVDTNVAMASVGSDTSAKTNTCSGNGTTSGCFTVAWEDSTWGNDYDMDGIQRLGYCVGQACDTFKMLCPTSGTSGSAYATIGSWTGVSGIRVATCAIQADAGHALTFGYTITGTTSDGAYFPILRPGGKTFTVGLKLHADVTGPNDVTFIQGTSTAKLLENPLWYAAKYGGFTDSTPTSGTPRPDLTTEWDGENNLTGVAIPDGIPDNYFNVRNPATLITALSEVFDKASQPDASAASVATNSTNLQTDSFIYQARFSSADWSGQLLAYALGMDGTIGALQWDAAIKMAAQSPNQRVILTRGATDGVAFDYANLTGPTSTAGTQQDLLDRNAAGVKDECGPERVAYLRGDATHEGTSDTFTCASSIPANKFRQRFNPISNIHYKLGDIVNSNPWYLGAPEAGYADSDYPGYSAFVSARSSRTPVVYVGANDGMLHGIDASTTSPPGGQEVLAYVPSMVYPNLSLLTDHAYNRNHRYFVDGSPMVADANLASPLGWRSVLIGGLGAGGKGFYALDVTNPATFSEANAADLLLWEFTETDDADMGYAYNLPPTSAATKQAKQIVKMANGKWAAILGNGYATSAGKAVLYLLFIEDGADGISTSDFVKIVADESTADNGLSTPVPYDTDNDGVVDAVYAGDLKGNLWKFLVGPNASDDTVTADPATWKVAFTTGTPLFTAKDCAGAAQPIISPPEVSSHPEGGQLVMFGTGKYLEFDDNKSRGRQSFYGIWDIGTPLDLTREEDLLEQTVGLCTANCTAGKFRVPSSHPISWRVNTGDALANCTGSCTPTHRGWYMDLLATGVDASVSGCPIPTSTQIAERVTGIPEMINGTIYFNTLIPSDLPCDAGGGGWLMSMDYLTGGLVDTRRIFDTDGSGTIDDDDALVGGYQVGAAIGGTTLIQNPDNTAGTNIGVGVSSLTSGNLGTVMIDFGGSGPPVIKTRLNWREIVQ